MTYEVSNECKGAKGFVEEAAMIVSVKDAYKLIGLTVIMACAVFVCNLFLNFNLDLAAIETSLLPEQQAVYDASTTIAVASCAISGSCLVMSAIVMLVFYIKNYVNSHAKQLGALKALGFSNVRIARNFWVFAVAVAMGAVLGYAISFAIFPAFYNWQNSTGDLPKIVMTFHAELLVYLVLLPSVVFGILAVLFAMMRLKSPVMSLLRGDGKERVSKKHRTHRERSTVKHRPFLQELGFSTVRSRPSLVFFMIFAPFCFSAMIQMGFAMGEYSSEFITMIMLTIGIALASTIMFLACSAVVSANAKPIAMLKVNGYSFMQCAAAILGGYIPFAFLGFAIGTIYEIGLMMIMVNILYANLGVGTFTFDWMLLLYTFLAFVVMFTAVMVLYAYAIKRTSIKIIMQE